MMMKTAFSLLLTCALVLISRQPALAQSFTVLYNFTGGSDGATPLAGVTRDASGNLYGTNTAAAAKGLGTVFRLVHYEDNWHAYALYAFNGINDPRDGFAALAGVVIGPDDFLYGTTHSGGDGDGCMQWYGCGTVFRIEPGKTAEQWKENVFHRFGNADGSNPEYGDLIFDHAGKLYGTTRNGGAYQQGAVYQFTSISGRWTETVLHSFGGPPDGASPLSGIAVDEDGILYGTTAAGGMNDCGTIYRLRASGSGWAEDVLYSFGNGDDGCAPTAGLIVDASGNLYGTTQTGGTGGGTVFELARMNGDMWSFSALTDLPGPSSAGPNSTLLLDTAGNLYGTTAGDGSQQWGSVFKLTRSDGGWRYTSLHDFTGGMDGGTPYGRLVLDGQGNVYGTASVGGGFGQGLVFEITADWAVGNVDSSGRSCLHTN